MIWFARLRGVAVERHSDASYIISYSYILSTELGNRSSYMSGLTGQAICPVTEPGKLFARLRNRTVEIHRLRIRTPGYATGQVTHPCGTYILQIL